MNKSDVRNSIASDVEAFLSKGGSVTIIESVKVKVKHPASGQQKISFGWKQPHALPSSVWKYII